VYGVEHIPAAPAAQLFSDVAPDHWVAKWASELYEAGYLSGCSSDPPAFCPDSGLNRTEGAVFFLRMLNGPDYDPPAASGIFEDVAPDFWGARWIEAAYDQGLIQTCGDNGTLQICPLDPLTRASAAYMLAQAKNLVQ
jgi:hypothetical protein